MWEYEAVVDHLVTVFTLDQAIFRHSCQELLMPILSDTQAAELLDGGSPKWEDKGSTSDCRSVSEAIIRLILDL